MERAGDCARQAIALDDRCQGAHCSMAYVFYVMGEDSAAIREAELTLELNPNSSLLVGFAGMIIGLAGEYERGCAIVKQAAAINVHVRGLFQTVVVFDHVRKAEYGAAFDAACKYRAPTLPWESLLRAATAALAGRDEIAAASYRELAERFPAVADKPTEFIRLLVHQDDLGDTLLKGLKEAKNAAMPIA